MIRFKSIISRIVVLHVLAVFVTSIVMSLALSWLLNVATINIHNEAMATQATTVSQRLIQNEDRTLSLELPAELRGLYSQAYGRYSYAVIDHQGKVLFTSLKDGSALFPSDPRNRETEFLEFRAGNVTISGASVRKILGGESFWVQAGEDLANRDVIIDDIVAEFFRKVGWITLPILLALLAIDIAIFRRALRPLWDASEIARYIGPSRTEVRLPVENIPSEVQPLVLAINQALDRLGEGFRVQREFTADAAHELRTPLTILRTRIDTLVDPETAKALHKDADSMAHIVGQLLDIAELDVMEIDPSETADLRDVCIEVVQSIAPFALNQDKDIALVCPPDSVRVLGSSEMLYRAIRNLAENAIKYTSNGSTVEIVVEHDGIVRVLDSGPGIPAAERPLIFQRFWRRDRNHAGSTGLGLSIVQRIVALHGATITVGDRPSGGTEFAVHFRRAGT